MKPYVSIIIPIYNVEPYVKQCLESVCKQSLNNIEIICVDDVSTDNSMRIVKEMAMLDSRITIIQHSKNKGLSASRNTALLASQGEYIGFVDSDDFISHTFYEELYNKAKSCDADIAQSPIIFFHTTRQDPCSQYALNNDIIEFDSRYTTIRNMDLYYNAGMCWNKIYKSTLLQEHALTFPEGLYWEDNPFVIKAAYYAQDIIAVPESIYYYRQRPDSIVQLANKKLHFDLLQSHTVILTFLNTIDISCEEYLYIFSMLTCRILNEYEKLCSNSHTIQYKDEFIAEWKIFFEKRRYKKELARSYKILCKKIQKNTGIEITKEIYTILKCNISVLYHNARIIVVTCLFRLHLLFSKYRKKKDDSQ
ncbi:MAG: glycosyltransferase family 2 protein [Desulfovibrionaceae bacterium]